jgi:hypothetical protein
VWFFQRILGFLKKKFREMEAFSINVGDFGRFLGFLNTFSKKWRLFYKCGAF